MTYKIITRKLKIVVEQIEKNNQICRHVLSKKYSDCYDKELWAISLYYMFINLFKHITVLLENKNAIPGVFILTRSCIDAFINLTNVLDDKHYKTYLKNEKRKLNQETDKIKEYIKNIKFDSEHVRQELIALNYYIENFLLKNPNLLTLETKFLYEKDKRKHAKISSDLEEFYKLLCEDVHCGYEVLKSHHILHLQDGIFKASKKIQSSKRLIFYIINQLLIILIKILGLMCNNFFNGANKDNLKNIFRAISVCIDHVHKKLNKK